ncbi:MAG: hypothetical protein ACOZCP_09170 [Pseudomonadota bacterium]
METRVRTKTLFLAAGAAWGLAMALPAAAGAAALALAVAWLVLFGDDPWPRWAAAAIATVALVAGIGAFAAAMVTLRAMAQQAERTMPSDAARKRATRALASGLVALVVATGVGALWLALERRSAVESRAADQAYRELAQAVHAPVLVSARRPARRIEVEVVSEGVRAGPYRLSVRVVEPLGGGVLAEHGETVTLAHGRYTYAAAFQLDDVVDNFRRQRMGRDGIGSLDLNFRVEAMLEPVLSEPERKLVAGREPVTRSRSATLRLAVVIGPAGWYIADSPAHQ